MHVTLRVKGAAGVPSLRCEVVRALFAEVLRERAARVDEALFERNDVATKTFMKCCIELLA